MNNSPANQSSRRNFVSVLTKSLGISVLLSAPMPAFPIGFRVLPGMNIVHVPSNNPLSFL